VSDEPAAAIVSTTRLERALKALLGFAAVVVFYIAAIRVAGGLAPLLVVVTLVINVVVHEAAHAVVALVAGHHVHVIAVGKAAFFPRMWRFTLKYQQRYGALGHVVHSPKRLDKVGPDWDGWITAAGPISNFVLAGLAFTVVAVWSYGASHASWNASEIALSSRQDGSGAVGLFGLVSLLIAFSSLASDTEGSDGQKLMQRREGYRPSDASRRLALLHALSIENDDKTDWDDALVRQVDQDVLDPADARLRDYLLVGRYLQIGDVIALKRLLGKSAVTQNCTEPFLVLIYAFAIALVDRNGDVAGQWLERVPHDLRRGFEYWRSKAVVCAAAGDYVGARAAVANAREEGTRGDEDDVALFAAIQNGGPLPVTFVRSATGSKLHKGELVTS
jgi:hypothetical protein